MTDIITKERDLLRKAIVRYGDRSRMGFVEPSELQQAIDDAFLNTDDLPAAQELLALVAFDRVDGHACVALLGHADSPGCYGFSPSAGWTGAAGRLDLSCRRASALCTPA